MTRNHQKNYNRKRNQNLKGFFYEKWSIVVNGNILINIWDSRNNQIIAILNITRSLFLNLWNHKYNIKHPLKSRLLLYLWYWFLDGWRAGAEDCVEGTHTWSRWWSKPPWSGPCSAPVASLPGLWYRAHGAPLHRATRIS